METKCDIVNLSEFQVMNWYCATIPCDRMYLNSF